MSDAELSHLLFLSQGIIIISCTKPMSSPAQGV